MRSVKKFVCICLSIFLLVSIVSACGKNTESSNGKTTIEFMHSSVEQERLATITKLIKKFEKQNPNIHVKQVPVEEDNYNTKIITLAKSGKLPAVLEVGQDYAKVMDKDQLIDRDSVTKLIKKIGEDKYYKGALNLMRTENRNSFTGVPISGWVQGIWYNKKMLESKGYSEPQNWDDVLKIAKAFTQKNEKKYGIALPTVEGLFSEQSFSQFALSNNANILKEDGKANINTPEMTEALNYYQQLSDYTMPGSNDTTEVNDAFMNQTVPMAIYSTYILPNVFKQGKTNDIGFAIPTKKSKAVFGTVSALTVSSGLDASQKKAAEKLISFMADTSNSTDWVLMSPGGAQPVSKDVVNNDKYKSNEVVKSFGGLSDEIAESFDNIQVFGLVNGKNYVKMGDITSSGIIPKMVNNVTVGKKDVNSELQKAEDSVDKIVNQQ